VGLERSTITSITSLIPQRIEKRRVMIMKAEKIFLSKKGMKELRKSISRVERDLHEAYAALRELDKTDTHEERLARMEKLSNVEILENELSEKRQLLANAKLLPRKRDVLKVAIGSVVDLIDTKGRIVRYTIVDTHEANPSDGRISIVSPLGKNLLGKQIKDMVEWSTGVATNRLQLVAIT
jgi:transcription elongation factor GreA